MILRLFLFWLLAPTLLLAQRARVDSLYQMLPKHQGRDRAQLYHQIISSTWDFDFDQALRYAEEEYELAKKIDDAEYKTVALTDMGMYYYFTGQGNRALQLYRKALNEAGDSDFGEFPAYTLTRIGNLFRVQGQFDSARKYYGLTEERLRNKPEGIALASLFFHYGWMYTDLSEFPRALEHLYNARDIRYKIGDSLLIAECWRVMAAAHIGMNRLDSAQYYLDKTMSVAMRYGDDELVIFASINRGDLLSARRETVAAIRSYEKALELLSGHDFKRYKAMALFHVGKVFDSRGDYLKAIEYYFRALEIDEEIEGKQEMADIYGWIGWAQANLHNYRSASDYGNKSLALMKEMNDRAGEAFAHNLLGFTSFSEKDFKKALSHYDSALELRQVLGLDLLAVNTRNNIARIYESQGQYSLAKRYYVENIERASKLNNFRILALANNSIGAIYTRTGDFRQAERHLNASRDLLLDKGLPVDRRDNSLNFARLYQAVGKSSLASTYYEKYIVLNDSVVNQENSLAALQRDALYQLDKKEKEIESLNTSNSLKMAQIEIQQSRIRTQNIWLVFGVFFVLVLAGTSYILFTYYRSKSRANDALSKLNREIHEQKEEIQTQAEELLEASQTIHDINRGLENAVEERTAQLKQAYQELDMFIYRSSHDFRRPLTTFMGLAEIAKISVRDATAVELFSKVNETAIHLDRMLMKLQEVSQMGSSDLVYREVSFHHELDMVLDHLSDLILEKKIRVDRQVEIKHMISSSPLIIRVILENVIENSIHYAAPENAFVRIAIREVNKEVEILIEDNGQGIPPGLHERIFDMYFRGSEKSSGNGLGLYLVKKAVDKQNGRIAFQSAPGAGSVFRIILPC